MSDYLFDKSGAPDPEVAELEQLLAPLAYRGAAPTLPRPPAPPPRRRRALVIAGAAVVAAAAVAALVIALRPAPAPVVASGKRVLQIGTIGTVTLEPDARVRALSSLPTAHTLALDFGALAASIHAPPRVFSIRTPRAVITDLGCAFTLDVDAEGYHHLVVTEGAVAVSDPAGQEIAVVRAGGQHTLRATAPAAPTAPPLPKLPPSKKKASPSHKKHHVPAAPPLPPRQAGAPL